MLAPGFHLQTPNQTNERVRIKEIKNCNSIYYVSVCTYACICYNVCLGGNFRESVFYFSLIGQGLSSFCSTVSYVLGKLAFRLLGHFPISTPNLTVGMLGLQKSITVSSIYICELRSSGLPGASTFTH